MAQLKRTQYDVLIDDGTDEGVAHVVTVIHGDMIRGEQQARARQLPPDAAIDRGSLYVWCAMRRLQLTELPYSEWIDSVLVAQPIVDKATEEPVLVPVDPTTAPSDLL